jgi:hypothetical protein
VSEAHECLSILGVPRIGQVELGTLARVGEGTGGGSLGLVPLLFEIPELHFVILSHAPGVLSDALVYELRVLASSSELIHESCSLLDVLLTSDSLELLAGDLLEQVALLLGLLSRLIALSMPHELFAAFAFDLSRLDGTTH